MKRRFVLAATAAAAVTKAGPALAQGQKDDGGWTFNWLAWSPVLLTAPDGRGDARFPRAMARVRVADGRTGLGWIEFNQPPT